MRIEIRPGFEKTVLAAELPVRKAAGKLLELLQAIDLPQLWKHPGLNFEKLHNTWPAFPRWSVGRMGSSTEGGLPHCAAIACCNASCAQAFKLLPSASASMAALAVR